MTVKPQSGNSNSEWQDAQVLYPLYAALAREFVIDQPSCRELQDMEDSPSEDAALHARQWFLDMDSHIQVHQLRQFLQTTPLTSDKGLQLLLEHHLRKATHTDSDRDKIDFLLVQYFSHRAPSKLDDADVDMQYVAQILEPVLGPVELSQPAWLNPLDLLIGNARNARSLNDLLTSGILEKGRNLKLSSKEKYFQPVAMVAFARFSFLMRRVFFRLMHQDLNAILDGLRELEQRGVNTLDCRKAQFSSEEPTVRLRMICQSWKVMFHAEYSSGQPLRMLVDLHEIVDTALAESKRGASTSGKAPRAKAASAGFAAASSDAPEFEVSGSAQNWDPDGSV
jgi:hypothetical protein